MKTVIENESTAMQGESDDDEVIFNLAKYIGSFSDNDNEEGSGPHVYLEREEFIQLHAFLAILRADKCSALTPVETYIAELVRHHALSPLTPKFMEKLYEFVPVDFENCIEVAKKLSAQYPDRLAAKMEEVELEEAAAA